MSTTESITQSTTAQPPRRTAANRENAQHSTGPRTPAGKARSSQNAAHHLFSPALLQTGEDPDLFQAFHNALLADLCPQNNLQAALADRIIAIHWRLRRLQSADNHLNQMLIHQKHQQHEQQNHKTAQDRFRVMHAAYRHNIPHTEADLAEAGLDPLPIPQDPPPGYFIAASFFNEDQSTPSPPSSASSTPNPNSNPS